MSSPGDVLAVLHELDRVAEERAAVHAGDEALDDLPGPQVEPGDAGDGLGVQEAARIVFVVLPRMRHSSIVDASSRQVRRQPAGRSAAAMDESTLTT